MGLQSEQKNPEWGKFLLGAFLALVSFRELYYWSVNSPERWINKLLAFEPRLVAILEPWLALALLALAVVQFIGGVQRLTATVNRQQQKTQLLCVIVALLCAFSLLHLLTALIALDSVDTRTRSNVIFWLIISLVIGVIYAVIVGRDVSREVATIDLFAQNKVWQCTVKIELIYHAIWSVNNPLRMIGSRIKDAEANLASTLDTLSEQDWQEYNRLDKMYSQVQNQLMPELAADDLIQFADKLDTKLLSTKKQLQNAIEEVCRSLAARELDASRIGQGKQLEINVLPPSLKFSNELEVKQTEARQLRSALLSKTAEMGAEEMKGIFRAVRTGSMTLEDAFIYFKSTQAISEYFSEARDGAEQLRGVLRAIQSGAMSEDEASRFISNRGQNALPVSPIQQNQTRASRDSDGLQASLQITSTQSAVSPERFARELIAAVGRDLPLNHSSILKEVCDFLHTNNHQIYLMQTLQTHEQAAHVMINWLKADPGDGILTEKKVIDFLLQTRTSVCRLTP